MINKLIVILGPTGVGKTEVSLRIGELYGIPIINADSRQIYRELPIGTAAPTAEQQSRVKHYFVGNHSIHNYYSASMFEIDVMNLLGELFKFNHIALMSGGSMLYIDAVCNGIDDIPTVSEEIRNKMKKRLAQEGLPALVEELHRLDPAHYEIVDKNNPRRVVHALEICHQTGKTYTSFRKNQKKQRPFDIIKLGLNRERQELYDRINARVESMISNGLIDEAKSVYHLRGLNALNTVGYKELFEYFDGLIPLEEAIRRIQSNTRQYMRKQLTWFKKDESIKWFEPENLSEIVNYIDKSVSNIK